MKLQCPGCRFGFSIIDEKIPEGKTLRILCPKCKTPIELGEKQPAEKPHVEEKVQQHDVNAYSSSIAESFRDDPLDFAASIDVVDDGVKTALLCVSDIKQAGRIAPVLQELDFWVVHATGSAFALGKLHHNTYDLIILEERFDMDKTAANPVLRHVQLLPMHVRRQFFLCLLSENKPTLDAMAAFQLGVNLILNLREFEKAKIILARALKEHRNFYSFFNAELARKYA